MTKKEKAKKMADYLDGMDTPAMAKYLKCPESTLSQALHMGYSLEEFIYSWAFGYPARRVSSKLLSKALGST